MRVSTTASTRSSPNRRLTSSARRSRRRDPDRPGDREAGPVETDCDRYVHGEPTQPQQLRFPPPRSSADLYNGGPGQCRAKPIRNRDDPGEGSGPKPGPDLSWCDTGGDGQRTLRPSHRGKSSLARLGLFINITADLIDFGSINRWTLQLHAIQPLRIYAGKLVGQVTFWVPEGQRVLYGGKYQGSMGPRGRLSPTGTCSDSIGSSVMGEPTH